MLTHQMAPSFLVLGSMSSQGIRFVTFPPVLNLQLKRFHFDMERMDMAWGPTGFNPPSRCWRVMFLIFAAHGHPSGGFGRVLLHVWTPKRGTTPKMGLRVVLVVSLQTKKKGSINTDMPVCREATNEMPFFGVPFLRHNQIATI